MANLNNTLEMCAQSKLRKNIEVCISSANDIALLDTKFLSNFYFRGQANSEWYLSSSLERLFANYYNRTEFFYLLRLYEYEMLQEFKWKYPLYEKNLIPSPDDNIEWLSLMQHYGACTRLLDATESIFVALFMATQNPYSKTDGAIWAINKNILNRSKYKQYKKDVDKKSTTIPFSKVELYSYNLANKFIGRSFPRGKCPQQVINIKPKMCNERLVIQQGLFLMPTDISVSFMQNLDSTLGGNRFFNKMKYSKLIEYSHDERHKTNNDDILMFKIVIPFDLKLGVTQLLSHMNISSETMFPGLSGLATSLNKLRFGLGDYEE